MSPRRGPAPRRKSVGAGGPIPDKPFFKIGELSRLVGVEPHVLRYWETEFRSWIRPEKTRTGQRMYRRADVDVMLTIRQLVRDEGYRIEGARKRLRALHGEPLELPEAAKQQLERVASAVRQELEALEALARSALGASST